MPEPPRCPKCGKPLDMVSVESFDTWDFYQDTGTYGIDQSKGVSDTSCPHCGTDLNEFFPEGVASWKSE